MPENELFPDVVFQPGEKVTEETLEEFSDGKGEDNE